MSSGHYKQVCERCGAVIAQCRCIACDKTVIVKGLCAKCAAQSQEQRSAEQQPTTAAVQQANAENSACEAVESLCESCGGRIVQCADEQRCERCGKLFKLL